MIVDDSGYFLADIFLSAFLLEHELFEIIGVVLLTRVLYSHFKLFLFLFQFDVADSTNLL